MNTGDMEIETGWTNLLAKYKLLKKIGKGGHGIVFLAQRNGKLYACKSVLAGKSAKEIRCMKMLRGLSGTVQLHEVIRDTSHTHLIIELCHCTLKDRIVSVGALSEKEAATLFKRLAIAVGEVHKKGLLHRDLKRHNIFLTTQGHSYDVKVGDFGTSRICPIGGTIKAVPGIGTKRYMSPEATQGVYTTASDVWGLGLILYECLTGKVAFARENSQQVLENLKKGGDVAANLDWSGVSPFAKDFTMDMLKVNPKQWLTISSIVEHPWIAKYVESEKPKGAPTVKMYRKGAKGIIPNKAALTTKFMNP